MLAGGASGAAPHHHDRSSELFYVVSGAAQLLADDRVLSVHQGDLVVVRPGTVHAFAAAPASDADLPAMITSGVERFEYFRPWNGSPGPGAAESILEVQNAPTTISTKPRSRSDSSRPRSAGPPQEPVGIAHPLL